MNKKQLRDIIKNKRDLLSEEEILINSKIIVEKLMSVKEYKEAHCIMCFSSFGSEVNTFSLLENIINEGKNLILPRVEYAEGNDKLGLYVIKNIKSDLIKGTYGILEPDPNKCKAGELSDIDLFICPGVVFDYDCNRVGYGKGYYDRLFASNKNLSSNKIGIAFDLQIVEKISTDKFDIPMDKIITEKREIS